LIWSSNPPSQNHHSNFSYITLTLPNHSFSALDYKTDAVLRRRLKEVTQDATVLIVAQRVGTIMDADQIIVLDKGEIVGRGRHEELMETNDIYREIAESQLKNASLTEE